MTLQEFITKYKNKTVDFDGAYGGQCVDLFNKYLVDVLGITNPIQQFPVASAYQIYGYAKNNSSFVCIPNDPTAVPQAGDIIIWNQGVGSHGHVGIFVEGDVMSFRSFEQNWNGIQKCVIVNHPYDHVTGWLRPKRNIPEPVVVKPTPQPIYTPEPVVTPTPVVVPQPVPTHTHTEEKPKPLIDLTMLDGNKTKIVTGIVIVIAILAQQGYIDDKMVETINMITTALIGYTLRDAIKKK
jgi:hypothetical protein